MNRFTPFFTKKIFAISLVFDVPISILFNYRHTSLRHIPFFSVLSLKIFTAFLIINYIIILLVFFILFWLSTMKRDNG